MKGYRICYLYTLIVLAAVFIGCAKNPITGRRQTVFIPESEMIAASAHMYDSFLLQNADRVLPESDPRTIRVRSITNKLIASLTEYMVKEKQEDKIKDFQWRVHVIDDSVFNAWCMPGGQMVMYTGMLDFLLSDDELASVMGHEIGHAIGRHATEQASVGILTQGIAGLVSGIGVALSDTLYPNDTTSGFYEKGAHDTSYIWDLKVVDSVGEDTNVMNDQELAEVLGTNSLFGQAVFFAAELGILRFSRKHELEADRMGVDLMHMAGYNMHKAPNLWLRVMDQNGSGSLVEEWISTHPSPKRRIKELEEYILKKELLEGPIEYE